MESDNMCDGANSLPVRSGAEVRIENNFKYHSPKPGQSEKYEMLRGRGKELALLMLKLCPDSHERALAITKLEEVIMWANASMARHE